MIPSLSKEEAGSASLYIETFAKAIGAGEDEWQAKAIAEVAVAAYWMPIEAAEAETAHWRDPANDPTLA